MSKEEAAKVAELGEKPGWKTTEFWLTILAYLIGAFMSSGALADDSQVLQYFGMAQMILAKLGYDHARKGVKASASHAKAVLMSLGAPAIVAAPVDPTLGSQPE